MIKGYTVKVMDKCSPPIDCCPASPLAISPQLFSSVWCCMIWVRSTASLGQLSQHHPLPSSCIPPAYSLAGQYEKLKNPWLSISTAQQQLKHRCVINIILTLNPKHITVLANSVPAETRTELLCYHAETDWSHHFQEWSQSPHLLAQVAPSEVGNKMT